MILFKYVHAYAWVVEIRSVYKLGQPIALAELMETYGMKSAPRGLVYTPRSTLERVSWKDAEKLR